MLSPGFNELINSSDAGDGILQLLVSIMPADALTQKVAKASADMVLALQDNIYCSRDNFNYLSQAKS